MAPRRGGEDGVVVGAVAREGAAGRAGLRPGDRITAINGERVRDVIDFHFNAGEARLTCAVEREGRTTGLTVVRRGAALGLAARPPPGEISPAPNAVRSSPLPRGMRKSLSEGRRLPLRSCRQLHHATDLEDADSEDRDQSAFAALHPVHAPIRAPPPAAGRAAREARAHAAPGAVGAQRDPHARSDRALPGLERRSAARAVHTRARRAPPGGRDDGGGAGGPHRASRASPAPPHSHRGRGPRARADARGLAAGVARAAGQPLRLGWGRALFRRASPAAASVYEGFPVAEDGIGLVRRFEDGWARARRRAPVRLAHPRAVTVVTGEMYAPRLRRLLDALEVEGLDAHVVPVTNRWFGGSIGVAGLLTGADIQRALAGSATRRGGARARGALRDGAPGLPRRPHRADLSTALGCRSRP